MKSNQSTATNTASRASGKIRTQQHNKDRLGSNSGPMGPEDQRKDKFGTRHNQDPRGIPSEPTEQNRQSLTAPEKNYNPAAARAAGE